MSPNPWDKASWWFKMATIAFAIAVILQFIIIGMWVCHATKC